MIEMIINLIPVGVSQGLILALISLGIFIPFRLLDFADLSSEGSYPLGGAMCALCLTLHFDPIISIILSSFVAGILGACTALIHIKLKINSLLAGIIMSTMAYSINLRLMGRPNIGLFEYDTLFSFIPDSSFAKIILLTIILLFVALISLKFLHTKYGLAFRAVGLNPTFAQRQSINVNLYIMVGLFAGNFLCGLAGSLMVQMQNYADIGMGVGIVIHALAALMIGETLVFGRSLVSKISAPIIGALIYQQIQGIALTVGFAPSDLKLLTGLIVLSILALRSRVSSRNYAML